MSTWNRWCKVMLVTVAGLALLVAGGCGGSSVTPGSSTAGTITGRVTNAQNPSSLQVSLDGQQLEVTPDAQGNFTIPNIPPGEYVVSVLDPATNSGAHLNVAVGSGQTANVGDVTLSFGGQITGIVSQVDANGVLQPMASVEVVAESVDVSTIGAAAGQEPPSPAPSLRLVAYTGEDGSYVMRAVPQGEYQVSVVVPGFEAAVQWVWAEVGHTTPCDFILRPSFEPGVGAVQGTVTAGSASADAGQPIVGALVSIYSQSPYTPVVPPEVIAQAASKGRQGMVSPPNFEWTVFTTLTDKEGHYSLNVPAGYQTIEVYAEGYEWVSQPIKVIADQTLTVDFALNPATQPVPVPLAAGGGTG
jgi:hypothetical protein